MSFTEFENLVERYLEGNISRAEEVRLLALIKESPDFKNRFKAKVRLHEAMNKPSRPISLLPGCEFTLNV